MVPTHLDAPGRIMTEMVMLIFVLNGAGANNTLYRNNGDGGFTKLADVMISTEGDRHAVPAGAILTTMAIST